MANPRNTFKSGDWLAECDRCASWGYASRLTREWTGLRVCANCWDPRHPQDRIRGRKDDQAPPWVRPKNEGIDVSPGSGNEISEDDVI